VLSYNAFLADLAISYENHLQTTVPNRQQRYGQYLYNMLRVARPDVANLLRGTPYDPFHKDVITSEAHAQIEKVWNAWSRT